MILECISWEELVTYANTNNLRQKDVHWLLDIDDTLIECTSYVGSTQWFDKTAALKGQESRDQLKNTINRWCKLLPFLKFRLVDPLIIGTLHSFEGRLTAVTSRNDSVRQLTEKNLEDNGLMPPIEKPIVMCGNVPKHSMVKDFIKPDTTYVFVDDKQSHVTKMHNAFPEMHCIWLNRASHPPSTATTT